jgi:hypothetical protein
MSLQKTLLTLTLAFCLIQATAIAQVKINEIMYDDSSIDDSTYVEIFGPAGTPLTGYQLVGVNGYSGIEYNPITLTGSIPSDGFFVVGYSSAVPNVDQINSAVDYQNGPDNILLKYDTTILDAVGYGNFSSPDTFFVGEGSPAPDQTQGTSLCRYPDGHDTDDNSSDFSLSTFLTPGTPNVLPGQASYYSLYQLRTDPPPPDEIFWTSGIATVPSGLFNGTFNINAYIQDEQAGINLFGGSFSFALGDCLWVKARLSDYNGLLELSPILELNVGASVAVPDPYVITCSEANSLGEGLESMLVRLNNVWITASSVGWPGVGADSNLTITDNTGETLVMRIDKDTELDGWAGHPEPEESFDLIGILNQYSVYQVLPRYQSDFLPVTAVDEEHKVAIPQAFSLSAPHPNPFNASTSISFSLAAPNWISVEIFAPSGRRVAVIAQGNWPAGSHSLIWSAGDLPSCIYLIRLTHAEGSQTVKALLLR